MAEAAASAKRTPGRHHLEIHSADVAAVIQDVYAESIFERQHRRYHRKGGDGREGVSEWALDLRRPLSRSEYLGPLAVAMRAELRRLSIRQVAGMGYGAFALLGGIVAVGDDVSSVLIRQERKRYGFQEILEGAIDSRQPVAIIDDLLSTGHSVLRAATVLRAQGMNPTVVLTVFRFSWRGGRELLKYHGIGSVSLASLSPAWPTDQAGGGAETTIGAGEDDGQRPGSGDCHRRRFPQRR
jgi:orotate phosphoribosyltransferase